jgi:hypothetical protein
MKDTLCRVSNLTLDKDAFRKYLKQIEKKILGGRGPHRPAHMVYRMEGVRFRTKGALYHLLTYYYCIYDPRNVQLEPFRNQNTGGLAWSCQAQAMKQATAHAPMPCIIRVSTSICALKSVHQWSADAPCLPVCHIPMDRSDDA